MSVREHGHQSKSSLIAPIFSVTFAIAALLGSVFPGAIQLGLGALGFSTSPSLFILFWECFAISTFAMALMLKRSDAIGRYRTAWLISLATSGLAFILLFPFAVLTLATGAQ